MNLKLFGVSEDKDASVWRGKADRALEFTVGHSVDVTDMFRVGRYSDGKVRLILVELCNGWDRRIILINCHKLKDFTERIFIAPDESHEDRRTRMLEIIKYRSQRDGKFVSVDNGILSVDNVQVFSLKDGKLNINNGQLHIFSYFIV